jgi:multicomponent Na+:H+ antiporter subunit C
VILALTVGALVAGAVYLVLQRDLLRAILGFVLLSHGINLLLFSAGGISRRGEPLGSDLDPATTADPLPQAFVLTAIVIAFGITIYLLALAVTGTPEEHDHDEPEPSYQPPEPERPDDFEPHGPAAGTSGGEDRP